MIYDHSCELNALKPDEICIHPHALKTIRYYDKICLQNKPNKTSSKLITNDVEALLFKKKFIIVYTTRKTKINVFRKVLQMVCIKKHII